MGKTALVLLLRLLLLEGLLEGNLGWTLEETLLHELLAVLDVTTYSPKIGGAIFQDTPTVTQSTGYGLKANTADSSFLSISTAIKELYLFERGT